MSIRCAVCGKQRAHTPDEKSHWLSRVGYVVAYQAILLPLGVFPALPTQGRVAGRRPKMCQVCEWTFGAFTVVVALILIGITYVVWSH